MLFLALHRLVALLLVADTTEASAAASADRVTSLPSLDGGLTGPLYAGYLDVDDRHYYYIFAPSVRRPSTDPLVLWSNGGPGCSSVGEGFWMETGPYQVSNDHEGVRPAPYSWNRVASLLYIEHPVGVGFSYSDDPKRYKELNDYTEASDLLRALQQFVQRFPTYAPTADPAVRPLYLAGESYAGEYVPHLAYEIATADSTGLGQTLRGFAVGNPVFNCDADRNGFNTGLRLNMLLAHGVISFDKYAAYLDAGCMRPPAAMSDRCADLFDAAQADAGTIDQQLNARTRARALLSRHRRLSAVSDFALLAGGQLPAAGSQLSEVSPVMVEAAAARPAFETPPVEPDFDPDHHFQSFCLGNATLDFAAQPDSASNASGCHPLGDPGRMATYLNRADVQAALHIRPEKIAAPDGRWTDCAGEWIDYNASGVDTLTAYYEPLFNRSKSFRALVYSGDEDIATVPTPTTQACVAQLERRGAITRRSNWTAWRVGGIAAGYSESYDRLTFATIRGAGHTTPQYQPLLSFELFSRWLSGAAIVRGVAR